MNQENKGNKAIIVSMLITINILFVVIVMLTSYVLQLETVLQDAVHNQQVIERRLNHIDSYLINRNND